MSQRPFSHRQLYISCGFVLLLMVVTCFVLFDGYAHAHVGRDGVSEIFQSIQPEVAAVQIVPDFTQGVVDTVMQFDFASDDSYQRYLDNQHPFVDLDYVPGDLELINSDFTANDASRFELRQKAGEMFADMAWHFWHDFSGDRLSITSAYRSAGFQQSLVTNGCRQDLCAKAGTSEHQAGLALDLSIVTRGGRTISMDKPNKYTDWLHVHAQEWGFHNTYQKGISIDGKVVEGWHRRYLGVELATLLAEKQETIAEYYKGNE